MFSKSGEVAVLEAIESADELTAFIANPPNEKKILVMPAELMTTARYPR